MALLALIDGLPAQLPAYLALHARGLLGDAGRLSKARASASMQASSVEDAGCAAPPGHVHVKLLAVQALLQLPPKSLRYQLIPLPQLLTTVRGDMGGVRSMLVLVTLDTYTWSTRPSCAMAAMIAGCSTTTSTVSISESS